MSLRKILTLALATLAFAAGSAHAQLRPGQDFTAPQPPQPTDGDGKIEVIEFFSYALRRTATSSSPSWRAGPKKLPPDVVFKRVPGVGSGAWSQLGLLYYSLEAMGKLDALHEKAFDALHKENQNLGQREDPRRVARQAGRRRGAVREPWRSPSPCSRSSRAPRR